MSEHWQPARQVESIGPIEPDRFAADYASRFEPVVVRGLAARWPLVAAGQSGAGAAAAYLRQFDAGMPSKAMRGPPEIKGRFFYSPDMRGFNFKVEKVLLTTLMDELIARSGDAAPDALYAGSNPTGEHMPGLDEANPLPLVTPGSTPRIWIGNATHVSAHYDFSDNIAVVALGRRRFTLFPPEQLPNLYVGPLNVTLAGQPVSMVDLRAPDLERFPRFAEAMPAARTAELEPGDAIFIPTMWWHAVDAIDPVNILVNYWYNPPPLSSPFIAMLDAILSIREMPHAHREALRTWFDHFVFDDDAPQAGNHLPPHARGPVGAASPERNEMLRRYILQSLNTR